MAHPRVWWKQAWDYFILVMVRAAGAAGEHAALSAARQLLYNAIMVPYSISFTVYQECGQVHDANPLVYADCIPSSVKARSRSSALARASARRARPRADQRATRRLTSWSTSSSGWTC